tara:strand:- start:4544 stop:5014 length:471 start_codon:yes stop_codon:yes gene_type:complete
MSKEKIEYSYEQFEEGIDKIRDNILALGNPFNRIVGVCRGGLFPATRLSYMLKLPLTTLSWSLRDYNSERESLEWLAQDINAGQKILLVDDIIDSGETINSILADWDANVGGTLDRENISIATCIYNMDLEITPDFWDQAISRKEDQRWVDFWWEK